MLIDKERWKNRVKENSVYIGSFLLPFLIMTAVCIYCKVEPFGTMALCKVDALHQYMPFFGEYYDKLQNMDSFFYSWNGALGHNFLSLWAYYLSSPLNLLLLLLPKTALTMGFSWLVVIKIGLTGLTTGAFLIHRSNKKNWKVIPFATAFALSSFMIGYCWNVMWLDAILMFPLVLIGFDKMLEEKNAFWYGITLALAMAGNYYIGFMICIFLVFWFLFYEHKGFGNFIKNGIRFAFFSILSAYMAAIVLLPAYKGIMKTSSAGAMTLPKHEWLTNWMNLLVTHLAGTKPMTNNNFDGNANLYVGMFAFFCVFLYLFGRRISWKLKIKRVLFLAVFIISFNEKIMNFVWHGFHDQYGIPNRFAFLYLFLIILTGFEAVEKLKAMRWGHVTCALLAASGAVLAFGYLADGELAKTQIVISLGLILVYAVFVFLYSARMIPYKACVYPLAVIAVVEVICSSFYGFTQIGQVDVSYYFADTTKIEALKESMPEDELVRTELVAAKVLDEATWHNLKSVGMFGSTVNGTAVTMMDHLGFFTGANEYLYKGATPLTNVLLNVKYNIRRGDEKKGTEFFVADRYEDIDLLENRYATSIGYGISADLDEWDYKSVYPFRVQNRFVQTAYGEEPVFKEIQIPEPELNDCTVEATGNNGEFRIEYGSSYEDNMVFSIPVQEGDDLYIHYDGTRVEKAIVKVGDEVRASKKMHSEIFHVGLVEGVDEVKVQFQLKSDGLNTGVVRLSAATFDYDLFETVHSKMMNQAVNVTEFTSNSVKGTVSLDQEGWILFSIPYDTGWTVKLNGEPQYIYPVADGLLGVKARPGDWNLELKFLSPGWKDGLMLSLVGIVLFFVVIKREEEYNKKLEKKKTESAIEPAVVYEQEGTQSTEDTVVTDKVTEVPEIPEENL